MKKSEELQKLISASRYKMQNPYAFINDNGDFDADVSDSQVAVSRQLLQDPYAYLNDIGGFDARLSKPITESLCEGLTNGSSDGKEHRYAWIERMARDLQLKIWKHRHQLWPEGVPENPIELLEPTIAAKIINFDFRLAESLGEVEILGKKGEVAGILDRAANKISISRKLHPITFRFTTMHEIGHALLHTGTMLHRDRPIDGSSQLKGQRAAIEIEADKFAAYFLMPEKLVRNYFKRNFGVSDVFLLSDDTAFALAGTKANDLIENCKSSLDLARILAKAEKYNSREIQSLANQFGVSVGAMAIRIVELGLVEL